MFMKISAPFLKKGRIMSVKESSKQIGVAIFTVTGLLSSFSCSLIFFVMSMFFTAGRRKYCVVWHGISKNTYWSPGFHPAEMPIIFFIVFRIFGYSINGKASAKGTRWFLA